MNGPDHYAKADNLIDQAHEIVEMAGPVDALALVLAEAQVHATLALAAATAMNIRRNGAVELADEAASWARVLE